jgi:hypothetical protein
MKRIDKMNVWVSVPMLVAGMLTLMIGIGHVFLPTMGYEDSVQSAMPPAIREHFYYLGTYAICSFLLAFGFISIYFSRTKLSNQTVVVSFVLALVWGSRAIFEFIYPVELKIFMLDYPHRVLKIVTSFMGLLYVISTLFGLILRRNDKFRK